MPSGCGDLEGPTHSSSGDSTSGHVSDLDPASALGVGPGGGEAEENVPGGVSGGIVASPAVVTAATQCLVLSPPTARIAAVCGLTMVAGVEACSVGSIDVDDLILCDGSCGGDNSAHGSGDGNGGTCRDSRDDGSVVVGCDGGLAATLDGLECIPFSLRGTDPRKRRGPFACTPRVLAQIRYPVSARAAASRRNGLSVPICVSIVLTPTLHGQPIERNRGGIPYFYPRCMHAF